MASALAFVRETVEFGNPQALLFLLLAAGCVTLAAIVQIFWWRRRPLRTHGSSYPLIGNMKLWWAAILILVVTALAAAQPRFAYGQAVFKRGTVDVTVVVDVSASMWVKDLGPSRLEVAIREVQNLQTEGILQTGDRVGLFVFGGTTIRKVHLSSNVERLMDSIRKLEPPETLTGDSFPWDSDIVSALEHIYASLDLQDRFEAGASEEEWRPARRSDRLVLLFTDGDFEASQDQVQRIDAALAESRRRGLGIYAVGIGTRSGVELSTVLDAYRQDRDYDQQLAAELAGQRTQLRMSTLTYLAQRSGGSTFTIDSVGQSAGGFLREAVASHRGVTFQLIPSHNRQEAWQYFVAGGILLFALAVLFY